MTDVFPRRDEVGLWGWFDKVGSTDPRNTVIREFYGRSNGLSKIQNDTGRDRSRRSLVTVRHIESFGPFGSLNFQMTTSNLTP